MTSKNNDQKAQSAEVDEVMTGRELAERSEQATRLFDDDQLSAIDSVATLAAMVDANGVESVDVSDFGTGFAVLDTKEKGQLVGVPFFIVDWRFNTGDQGEFVSAMVFCNDGRKFVINDGSTGIFKQLQSIEKRLGKKAVVKVPKGLTESNYFYIDDKGEKKPATTYYLSLSK